MLRCGCLFGSPKGLRYAFFVGSPKGLRYALFVGSPKGLRYAFFVGSPKGLRYGRFACTVEPGFAAGRLSATSDVFAPPPVAKTMYCLPLCMKVIGTALVFSGIGTIPTCLPVALSTA